MKFFILKIIFFLRCLLTFILYSLYLKAARDFSCKMRKHFLINILISNNSSLLKETEVWQLQAQAYNGRERGEYQRRPGGYERGPETLL